MQWELLTATELQEAARAHQVCIVNFSALEKHGEHLPLGTDMLLGHRLACLAAEREPAVVFPPHYLGKIYEAAHWPGACALPPELLVSLARTLFLEIARNGFPKILVHNSHGGNTAFLRFLVQSNIAEDSPYTLYLPESIVPMDKAEEHRRICPIPEFEHAGEIETSLMMALFPDTVRHDRLPQARGVPQGRLRHLEGLVTAMDWYADFPDHYAGSADQASQEKGKRLLELYVSSLARQIALVTL
jgi:creatinine amidohydrolase